MPMPNQGFAASDLGLGDALQAQVAGETEEQRKKRMQQQQQSGMMPPGTQSPATLALFGGLSAVGR